MHALLYAILACARGPVNTRDTREIHAAYNLYTREGACKPDLAYTYLTCTRASATRLAHTRVLCTRVSTSSILRAHACLHVCEMKNVLCRVHATRVPCQD